MIFWVAFTPHMVIPDEAKRRSGIHSGTFFGDSPEWIPGLLSVARDDRAGEWEVQQ
jgi:hypothetical protein